MSTAGASNGMRDGTVVFVGEPGQCASGTVFERYLGATA